MLRRRTAPTPPVPAEVVLARVRAVAVDHRIAFRLARRLAVARESSASMRKIAVALAAVGEALDPPGEHRP